MPAPTDLDPQTETIDALVPLARGIAAELASLARAHDEPAVPAPGAQPAGWQDQCVELANIIYRYRRARGTVDPLFESHEPNWHMALRLYIVAARGETAPFADLCRAARLGPRATRRRVDILVRAGLIERGRPGPSTRATGYRLADDGRRRVETYLRSLVALIG